MDNWLRTFCVLCDSCMSSESLVIPLPPDLETRQKWVDALFPTNSSAKFQMKKVTWLRNRLLRQKATRYRICVYHFSRDSFEETTQNGEIVINTDSLPLSMESDDYDVIPRGPNSVCKCVLCDDWKKQTEMVILRNPSMESEKVFLCDVLLHADKGLVRKTIHSLSRSGKSALICSTHFPDQQDPFSILAERRLLYNVQAECVLCSHTDECTAMIPFPSEEEEKLRTKWINSMCREPWVYRYLTKRLAKDGRHYLCSSHFSKNSLRYQTGLGLYRKPGCSPLLSCTNEEERQTVWDLTKSSHEYHPLALESIDSNGIGPIDYDQVVDMLGFTRLIQIESEMHQMRTDNMIPRKKIHGLLEVNHEEEEEELQHHEIGEKEDEEEEDVEEDGVIYDEMHQLEMEEGEVEDEEINVTVSPDPPQITAISDQHQDHHEEEQEQEQKPL
ncbi:unnamed protein product [Caenorhabditis angaria]|uniref:THAP-type domain-containing protein n=1 Tax=Caenorhabditis angaria TaxID=860376 RepID=A0A9P1IW56_9PELO|nr:unnamed protein product [Caenorhabditis angaria]